MKRLIVLGLCLALLWGCAVPVCADVPQGAVSLTGATAIPGETVSVPVKLENNPGLITLRLQITYDRDLELVNVWDTGTLSGWYPPSAEKTSPYILYWKNAFSDDLTATGTIATLTFRIKPMASNGKKSVSVAVLGSSQSDGTSNTFTVSNAAVSVTGASGFYGDANTDGTVDTGDLVSLKKYLAGLIDRSAVSDGSDVNADGLIDTTDLVVLKKYLAGLIDCLG